MLQNEAMIVKLSISQWTARRYDKGVTDKVNDDYGAGADAGRYNKMLVPKEALKLITQAVSAIKTFHYDNTLPWDDAGSRLLPVANFMDYSKELRRLGDVFNAAVDAFVKDYPSHVTEARRILHGMFKDDDYPSVYELRYKYRYDVDVEPVPLSKDFRVSLQEKDAAEIKSQIDAKVKEREAGAMKDLFLRLHKHVSHAAETLKDPEAKFKDSLIDNLVGLVELLPKLNIANDANLTKLTKEVTAKLVAYSPKQLRTEPEVRSKAAADADAILKKLSGYTG